jgi:hypothetical protein
MNSKPGNKSQTGLYLDRTVRVGGSRKWELAFATTDRQIVQTKPSMYRPVVVPRIQQEIEERATYIQVAVFWVVTPCVLLSRENLKSCNYLNICP